MKNSNQGRGTPYVRPIQRVELSESNVKIRMILIVVLLAIASVSIVVGLSSALKTEPDWQRVEAQAKKINCSADFILNYDFTDAGSEASSRFKALTNLYSEACEDAYRIFTLDMTGGETANMHDLNRHPNETVTVDPALYHALSLVQKYQNRGLYLAPVYVEYDHIFKAETEVEAASYDPVQNPELVSDLALLASYGNDPDMIDIQLLGNNQVKLVVAEEYLSFIKSCEIEKLIDFGWMKNAFIADFLAQVLLDNGFTDGYLVSFDGFTRNLDTRGNTYSFNVFNRQGSDIYNPAVMTYAAPASIVFLRDYPMTQSDAWQYYAFPNGRIANMLIDPADGMNKASVDSLVSYGKQQGCAEVLLQMIPVFIADEFASSAVQNLTGEGIHSVWCEGQSLCYTDEQLQIELQPQEDLTYVVKYVGY